MQIRAPTKHELEPMFEFRWRMLRKPFDLPKGSEQDDKDHMSNFVIAFDEENKSIIGCGRILISDQEADIDCVAVNQDYRKQGIGTKIIEYLHKIAIDKKVNVIKVQSRSYAQGFYAKLGYKSVGVYYAKHPTNLKHINMEKII